MAGKGIVLLDSKNNKFSIILLMLFVTIVNILVVKHFASNLSSEHLSQRIVTNSGMGKNKEDYMDVTNEKISKTKIKEGIILLWNFNYLAADTGLNKTVNLVNFYCGDYQCKITTDRSYLKQSNVVVFNPRVSKGNNNVIYPFSYGQSRIGKCCYFYPSQSSFSEIYIFAKFNKMFAFYTKAF